MYVFIFLVKVTEWPHIGKIAAHSTYDMFHGIKYLIVSLVFSHLGFWSGNLFLIAPFPDLCLLVPFHSIVSPLCLLWSHVRQVLLEDLPGFFFLLFLGVRPFSPHQLTGSSHMG